MCPNINHPDYKQLVEDLRPEYKDQAEEYAHLAWIRNGETESIPTGEQAKDLLAPKLNSGKQSSKPSLELGEALKSLVSDNGKTAKDALQTISEHDGQYQDLARELLKHEPNGLDSKLILKDNTQKESTYNPNDHSINISRSFTDDPYHYMHEAIHAITSREIQSQLGDAVGKDYKDAKTVDDVLKIVRNKNVSEPVKDLVHLFLKSKEALAGEKHYGFKNLEEFVAEAFTNSDFQERLNTVKGIGGKTLWQHFVEAIRSILGFPPKVGSALSETIRAALDLSKQDHSEAYNKNFEARDSPFKVEGLGSHGAWIDSNGKFTPVENTYGHADVAEEKFGTEINKPEDYNKLYQKKIARITNSPNEIYVQQGDIPLTKAQRQSLEDLGAYKNKLVTLDKGKYTETIFDPKEFQSQNSPQSEKFSEDEFTRHLGEEDFKTTQDWFNKLPDNDKQYLNSQYNGDALKLAQDHFEQNGEEVTGTNKSINAEEAPLSGNANDEVKARKIQIQNVKDLLNKNIEQPLVVTETPIQKQFKDLGYQFLNDQDLTTYTNLLDNFVNSRSRTSDPVTERIPTENLQTELAQLQQKANQGKFDYFAGQYPEAFAGKTFNDFGNEIDIVNDYVQSIINSDQFETESAKTPQARLDTEDAIRDIQQSMIDNNRLDELRTTLLKDNIDLYGKHKEQLESNPKAQELIQRSSVIKEAFSKLGDLYKEIGIDNDKIISQIYDYAVNTDPSELQSYSDVRKLQYLAQALNTDGYFPFINTFISKEMKEILATRGLNFKDGYHKDSPVTSKIESIAAKRDRVSGGQKVESDFITKLGVNLHDSYNRGQRMHVDFLEPLTNEINKHWTKEMGRPFTDIENNRMGYMATLRQRYTDELPNDAIKRNLVWTDDSAKNIEDSNIKSERDAAIDQRKFAAELNKGANFDSSEDQRPVLESNFEKLVGKEALENIKDNQVIFEMTNPLAKMASEFGYGKEYHEIENYFPSFTLPTGSSHEENSSILYQNELDLMTPGESAFNGMKGNATINASRNGMSSIKLRQRVVPEGRRLVLNLNNMISNRGRLNILDATTAIRRREMANVLKSRDLSFFLGDYHRNGDRILFDQRGKTNLLKQSYNQEWAAMIQANSYIGTFQQAFNGLTRRFSVAQLASLYRAPVHILGNLTSYFVNHPERVFDLMKSFGAMLEGYRNPDYKNFLDRLFFESRKRSWDVTQDRSTNIHIGLEGDSPLQQMWQGIKSSKVFQGIGKVDSTLQKVLFAPLKWSDTSSANAIMLTEYLHNERNRLNNPNLQFKDLVLNDKSGISYHKALNETEKNVTIGDASRRGLWLNNTNPSISLLRNLTMAFAGKKIMNATNFTVAIHNLMNGSMNSADKAATVKFMGGIVAQTAMFELVKWGLQGFTGNAILQNQKQNTDDSLESLYRKQMSEGSLTPRQKILLEQEISSRRHLRSAFQNADSNNWNLSKLLSVGAIASNMLPNMFVGSSLLSSQEDGIIHLLYDTHEQATFNIAKQAELLRLTQVKEQARAVGNGSLYGQSSQKISDLQSQKAMTVINRQQENFQDFGGIIGEFLNQNYKFGQAAVNSVYKSQEIYPSDVANIMSAYGVGQPDVDKFFALQKQMQAPEDQAQVKLDQKIAKLQTQGRNY